MRRLLMALIVLAAVAAYARPRQFGIGQSDQVTRGLVAYWSMRTTGTTVHDEIGGNTGGASNSVSFSYATGIVGSGSTFNGTNYILVPNSSSLALGTSYTVSFWVKTSTAQTAAIVAKGDTSLKTGVMQIYMRSTVPRMQAVSASISNTINGAFNTWATSPYDGVWHNVSIVRDETVCSGYMDGLLVETGSFPSNFNVNGSAPLYVGKRIELGAGQLFYSGNLDEVRVYNVALSADEIKQLYRMGKTIFDNR